MQSEGEISYTSNKSTSYFIVVTILNSKFVLYYCTFTRLLFD